MGTDLLPDSITTAFSAAVQGLEAPLVDVGTVGDLPAIDVATGELLSLERSGRLPDLTEAVALVEGQPMPDAAWKLEQLGAVGAIFVNPEERLNELIITTVWGTPSFRNVARIPKLAVTQVRRSDGEAIRELMGSGRRTARLTTEVTTGWKPLRLAVARIQAPVENAPIVLLGGHIDAWYHGGTDEGASNAAMVELARGFHKKRNMLRRSLLIAWWPGHSNGRYAGATWFADHFFGEFERRGVACLNIDGVGQIGAKRFEATTTLSLAPLARSVVQQRVGEEIRPSRPGRHSDQAFSGIGLPLLQFNHSRLAEDGEDWWWHTADDTLDKVDSQVLKVDTDLYVDALADLLAAPVLPVDLVAEFRGLGRLIEQRQTTAGRRFDLSEAKQRQEELVGVAQRVAAAVAQASLPDVDLALVRILRPIHRVLYTLAGAYHPDVAVEVGLLPGLAPVQVLASAEPGSDRYGFAQATLVRERNRLLGALDRSLEEANRLEARLAMASR